MPHDLSIVIVNWNTRDLLRECLHSISNETKHLSYEIFVVDNASSDQSVEMLKHEFPQVTVIINQKNLGFGRANNQAIRQCNGEYILMLNPDTIIVANAIEKLVQVMKQNPNIGVCGPKTIHPDGSIQVSWAKFPSLSTIFTNNVSWKMALSIFGIFKKLFRTNVKYTDQGFTVEETIRRRKVDYLLGQCLLTRMAVLDRVGLFDEDVFMYEEEPDLCYRIYKGGWEVWFIPEAEIIHHEKKSIKQLPNYMEHEVGWYLSARSRFFAKHSSTFKRILFHLVTIISSSIKLVIFSFDLLVDKRKKLMRERIRFHWYFVKWHLKKLLSLPKIIFKLN